VTPRAQHFQKMVDEVEKQIASLAAWKAQIANVVKDPVALDRLGASLAHIAALAGVAADRAHELAQDLLSGEPS